MSVPRFTTTKIDPRRLSHARHQIARPSYGERQRTYGAIKPMEEETTSWRPILIALTIAIASGIAFVASLPR